VGEEEADIVTVVVGLRVDIPERVKDWVRALLAEGREGEGGGDKENVEEPHGEAVEVEEGTMNDASELRLTRGLGL